MMPGGAARARGAQKAALAGAIFEKRTAPELKTLLTTLGALPAAEAAAPAAEAAVPVAAAAEVTKELGAVRAAVVRDAARDYAHEMRKSKAMAAAEAALEAKAYHAW
jgi:Zn-dependent M32 family carboxypeptidase